ncbi:hypothetical protein H4Q26_010427 [Puccinia striiformis f. sp. tritici PST-130]|nr:hypothetical protein H4Q26_010427 [Puccinia striiformis f. sp. tritici PST-130]
MESETAYSLLHLPRSASSDEILMAYRRESLKYHPRRYDPGDRFIEIHFKKLAGAYETLIDPQKRLEYDRKLSHKERSRIKNPDSTRLFDPEEIQRQRRHSTSTNPRYPSAVDRVENRIPSSSRLPHPPPPPLQSDQRQRRSSFAGLVPIPNLIRQQQQPPPIQRVAASSIQSPIRAGSCGPAVQSSGFRQSRSSTSRLDESLLSMRLNSYHPSPPPNPAATSSSPQSGSTRGRVDRQSIINELNNRARSNSSNPSTRRLHPISTTTVTGGKSCASSASSSTISPSSSLSTSLSPRLPHKFSSSPSSSAAPISRQNFPPFDLSSHFLPNRNLATSSSSGNRFPPSIPNDDEYQPLILPSNHQLNRPPHTRLSSSSSTSSSIAANGSPNQGLQYTNNKGRSYKYQ